MLWPPGDAEACARALSSLIVAIWRRNAQRVLERFRQALTWEAIGRDTVTAVFALLHSMRRAG